MTPRTYADTFQVSPLTLGTMRLPSRTANQTAQFLDQLHELGINTHHSSHEYDTDPLYLEALRQANCRHELRHVVKLACPHFGEPEFDADVFCDRIEDRLQQLRVEQIDNIQWLYRTQPIDDTPRLTGLASCREAVIDSCRNLQQAGKVRTFSCFPYSVAFAEAAAELPFVSGQTTYLNLLEREYVPLIQTGTKEEGAPAGFLAIRPLAAGTLRATSIESQSPEMQSRFHKFLQQVEVELAELSRLAIQFPLLHPSVASVIISLNSIEQARAAVEAAESATPALDAFQRVLQAATVLPKLSEIAA